MNTLLNILIIIIITITISNANNSIFQLHGQFVINHDGNSNSNSNSNNTITLNSMTKLNNKNSVHLLGTPTFKVIYIIIIFFLH